MTTPFDNGILSKLNGGDTRLYDVVKSDLDGARLQLCFDRITTCVRNLAAQHLDKKCNVIRVGSRIYTALQRTKPTDCIGNTQLPAQVSVKTIAALLQP